ncbi:hypothetical protein [Glaciibacter superstes]|uniref:hypothetical protein n=1 Tax=Glaciibacter superstes TaxID=501023 RepID=UPI0004056A54|nr:hypothetical protein [Glaciibacter superstes]
MSLVSGKDAGRPGTRQSNAQQAARGVILRGRGIGSSFTYLLAVGVALAAIFGLIWGAVMFGLLGLTYDEAGLAFAPTLAVLGGFAGAIVGAAIGLVSASVAAFVLVASALLVRVPWWGKPILGAVGAVLGVLATALVVGHWMYGQFSMTFPLLDVRLVSLLAAVSAALAIGWAERSRIQPALADVRPLASDADLPARAIVVPGSFARSSGARFVFVGLALAFALLVVDLALVFWMPGWDPSEECPPYGGGRYLAHEWTTFPPQTVCQLTGGTVQVVPPFVAPLLTIGIVLAMALISLGAVLLARSVDRADRAAALTDAAAATAAAADAVGRARHPFASRSRSAGVFLAAVGVMSPVWMLLLGWGLSSEYATSSAETATWYFVQLLVAAAIPLTSLVLLGLSLPSSLPAASALGRGTREQVPAVLAILSVCTLALTVWSGGSLVSATVTGAARLAHLDSLPPYETGPVAPDPTPGEGAVVVPTPEAPSTLLTEAGLRAGMEALLDTAVDAAGPAADWNAGLGPESLTLSPVACLDGAGVSYPFPEATFATGVITDTSTDEHDREVTDRNVAASERIVAAWERLGYNEDSGLGGNLDLGAPEGAPALSLHVRYSFGFVTLTAESRCVVPG